ncbi:MAG TPA: hypothetical protein VG898_03535 [Solirubrobacterales bacterium]|nr:hypothetical protein [Solirubrobacterales bacterium]
MRKRSILIVGLAIAATTAIVTSGAIAGPTGSAVTSPDGNAQAVGAVLKPKKLYKKQWTPAALEVTTALSNSTRAGGVPVPTTRVVIDFDKNTKVFSKGYPTCEASKLQSVSTEVARRECKKAIIGTGNAEALLPVGSQVFNVKQEVTAFNGVPQGGKPVILLHSYGTTPIQTALVLTGVVTNYNKEGYGPRLDVEVPLIAGGAGALIYFNVTVDKKYSYKGKKVSYIQAKCPASKKLKARSVFTFLDNQTSNPIFTASCSPKPEPKKK